MPISYSIDQQKRLIVEVWTGDVTATDLAAYWRDYLADPAVLAIRRTLVDLRQCRILFTGSQLSALINSVVIPVLEGRDWKTAIVVDQPAQYGVSRQYHVFAESYSVDSIFSDPDAALTWLLS
jgi:hypothetical protein